jgi:hypothetical protein
LEALNVWDVYRVFEHVDEVQLLPEASHGVVTHVLYLPMPRLDSAPSPCEPGSVREEVMWSKSLGVEGLALSPIVGRELKCVLSPIVPGGSEGLGGPGPQEPSFPPSPPGGTSEPTTKRTTAVQDWGTDLTGKIRGNLVLQQSKTYKFDVQLELQ